jgi:hypothetical protein
MRLPWGGLNIAEKVKPQISVFCHRAISPPARGEHKDHRELRKFTADPGEFAEKIVFILRGSNRMKYSTSYSRRDCFVAALLAMPTMRRHCERSEAI